MDVGRDTNTRLSMDYTARTQSLHQQGELGAALGEAAALELGWPQVLFRSGKGSRYGVGQSEIRTRWRSGNSHSACEYLLEVVGSVPTKSTGNGAQ